MRRILAVAVLAVLVGAVAPAAGAQADGPRVLIVSLPTLTWSDVDDLEPPAITDVAATGSVASLSIRTIGPTTTPAEGYVTIGAGNRATIADDPGGFALDAATPVEGTTADVVYRRRTGVEPVGAVLQLSIAEVERRARSQRYGAEPGSLGEALGEAGLTTAVVASADLGDPLSVGLNRPAALAVMDRDGQVDGGVVGPSLVVDDPAAPFGLRLDPDQVLDAATTALAEHDVVLVEAGDLVRADAYRSRSTPAAAGAARRAAVEAADDLVAALSSQLDPERDLLLLVAPSSGGGASHLTVFVARGPGFGPGRAESATTRRPGYVTLPDIGPTVLDFLGVELPDAMTGTAITASGGSLSVDDLVAADEVARFRDRAVGPVSVTFIVVQVLAYAAAAVAVATGRDGLRSAAAAVALLVLALPTVAFLSGLVRYDRLALPAYVAALFAAAATLAAVAWAATRRHPVGPPLALVAAGLAVQVVDIVSGGHLQIDTPFGYSPIVAGRFAGYGNLSFALTAMAALVVATGAWVVLRPRADARPPAPTAALAFAAVVLAVTVVVDGLPGFGSDVGGVLAAVPAYALALLLLRGWRVSWLRFALLTGVGVAVVGVFAAVDLARPEDERTHLGRFVDRLFGGEGGDTLARKAEANVSILTSSVWTWLIPFALGFLAFLTWRRGGPLRSLQATVPGLRALLVAAVALCTLGMAVNDSGVAVPATMFGVLLPYLTWLAVAASAAPLRAPAGGTPASPPGAAGR